MAAVIWLLLTVKILHGFNNKESQLLLGGCVFIMPPPLFKEESACCFAAVCPLVGRSTMQHFPLIFFAEDDHTEMKFGT